VLIALVLILIVLVFFNVFIAFLNAPFTRTMMGIELFMGGIFTLIIPIADLLGNLGIGVVEGFLLFFAGTLDCIIGYYMVLREGL
jgi:hypothetical protein